MPLTAEYANVRPDTVIAALLQGNCQLRGCHGILGKEHYAAEFHIVPIAGPRLTSVGGHALPGYGTWLGRSTARPTAVPGRGTKMLAVWVNARLEAEARGGRNTAGR